MTAPDDLPDHIWAQAHTGTNRQGRWSVVDLNVYAPASKYVRADVVDELMKHVELLASLPIREQLPDDVPVTGVDGVYITQGHVLSARAALARYRGGA